MKAIPVALLILTLHPSLADRAGAATQLRSDTTVVDAGPARHPAGGSLLEEMTIGVALGSPDYEFSQIHDVLVTREGTIWILEVAFPGSSYLRQYDATGRFLRAVGRQGEGPGEYRAPTGIAQLPDGRVALRDITGNRINVYRLDGSLDTTWTFATRYSWPIRGRDGLHVDSAGILWLPFEVRLPDQPLEGISHFLRLRTDGSIIDSLRVPELPVMPNANVTITQRLPGGGIASVGVAAPYQPRAGWWWHPDGYFVTAVTDRYAIDLLRPRGTDRAGEAPAWRPGDPVLSIRRNSSAAVEISAAERVDQRAYMEASVRLHPGTPSGPVPEVPRTKPAFRFLTVAADGRLWVSAATPSERYEPPPRDGPVIRWREPVVYDVFERDGAYIGRVPMPAESLPRRIEGDTVWAVHRDENGVNVVKKYQVVWR